MRDTGSPLSILVADDDADDRFLTEAALTRNGGVGDVRFVADGVELLEALAQRGERPGIVLLDLNMPRKDGREALREIKDHEGLRAIPIVVFTTSTDDADVRTSYELGASSVITKPATFDGMLAVMGAIARYWGETVRLPE
jgi:CheY-like chemotaxis protein